METQEERTKTLRVRLTPADMEYLQSLAREEKTTVSELVRRRLLGVRPPDAQAPPEEGASLAEHIAYGRYILKMSEALDAKAQDVSQQTRVAIKKTKAMIAELEERAQSAERGDANAK